MKPFRAVICIAILSVLVSCGDRAREIRQTADNIQKIAQAGKNSNKILQKAEQRHKERLSKGDTLAMPYNQLLEYLPAEIEGYTAEEPQGSMMNAGSFSLSQIKRKFSKGNDFIEIELIDYNQAQSLFAGLLWWGSGITFEDNSKAEKTFSTGIEDVLGYEMYEKKSHEARLTYAVAWRFFLVVVATNQPDTKYVKNLVRSMKITDLANL